MTLTITLNAIRAKEPCTKGYAKLLAYLGKTKADDEPLSFETILESNGLDDALWCLRALPASEQSACRLLACDFAEATLKYVPEGEDRPRLAIETARRFARGEATKEEFEAVEAAARAARAAEGAAVEAAAWAAWAAARAAKAEGAVKAVAWAAARAAWAAEGAAARAAARAEGAVKVVAWAAEGAARVAARTEFERIFRVWLAQFETA